MGEPIKLYNVETGEEMVTYSRYRAEALVESGDWSRTATVSRETSKEPETPEESGTLEDVDVEAILEPVALFEQVSGVDSEIANRIRALGIERRSDLLRFVQENGSRQLLDIDGIGPATLQKLIAWAEGK